MSKLIQTSAMGLTIKIDSREQLPYKFNHPTEVGALACGDYSLAGLENHVAIERKTIDDLIGCLTKGRARFERELSRGRALDYFALVLEASLADLANGNYRSKMLPKSAVQSLMAFSVRYHLPIFFCESRKYAQKITESLLLKFAGEIQKKHKSLEAQRT